MTAGAEWSIVFYLEDSGASPVEEFLDSLDAKTQRRLAWSIEQLRLRNVTARAPLARHLEGKLWELREESQTNIYRVIYFFFTGRQIIFVHGFQKKTQKTPRREIELALRRWEHFIQREGGEP
jgi:phage-related protein